ncbi:hypothetical protein JMUB6875_43560 [Nocardia sp. JMUB6875]
MIDSTFTSGPATALVISPHTFVEATTVNWSESFELPQAVKVATVASPAANTAKPRAKLLVTLVLLALRAY